MRWFWVDRYTEFVSGQYATAVKNVSLAEDQLRDHFPGRPMMPNSLIVEGMAQTGGLLVSEYYNFQERVVLAKLAKSRFYGIVVPGDRMTFRAEIHQIQKDGAMVTTTCHVGDRLQAESQLYFAHLDNRSDQRPLFEPHELLHWLTLLKVFEVGVKADGSRIQVPASMARGEWEPHQPHADHSTAGEPRGSMA